MDPIDQPNTREGFRLAKAIVTEHLHGNNLEVVVLLEEIQDADDPELNAAVVLILACRYGLPKYSQGRILITGPR